MAFFFVFFLQLISAPTFCPSAGSVVSRPTMLKRSLMKSDRGYTAGNRRGDCLIGEYELFPIDRQTDNISFATIVYNVVHPLEDFKT